MQLSAQTLTVLKNFSLINPSIRFQPGNVVKTISAQRTIVASATIEESFDAQFCIFDLNRFLSVLTLFNDPTVEVDGKFISIKSGPKKISYIGADESHLMLPPDVIKMPNAEIQFNLTNEMLTDLTKAMSILGLPEVAIVGNGEKLSIVAIDTKGIIQDGYSREIGDTNQTFKIIFAIENLKLLPADYTVSIGRKGDKGLSHFSAKGLDYYIAVEAKSTYE